MAVYLCVCVSSPCACSNDTFTIHLLRTAEVVVYIAGGATYEEATKVAELNASGGIQVVLGGSYVHTPTRAPRGHKPKKQRPHTHAHARGQKKFRYRDSNPSLLGESQV